MKKRLFCLLIFSFACILAWSATSSAFTHSLPAPHTLPWVDSAHESHPTEIYTYDKAFWFQLYSQTYLCYVRDSFSMPEWHNYYGFIATYIGDPVNYGMWCGSDQGGYWGFGLSGGAYLEITPDTPWVDTTNDMLYVDSSATFTGPCCNTINPGYVEQYAVLFPANISMAASVSLTVVRNPEAGGGIASSDEEIQCGVNGYNYCQADFPVNTEVELEAYPADSNWTFVRFEWNNGASSTIENPHTFTMDAAKTVTAVFFKTFRNAVGNFYQNIDDTGGWCTDYVRYETGVDFTGNAYQWWQEAINGGYNTGSEPAISAIIVFNQDSLEYGHVGIVTGYNATTITIRDSNWCNPYCFLVKEHPVDRNRSDISGYIYYTPQN